MVQLETVRIRLVRGEIDADQISEARTLLERIARDSDGEQREAAAVGALVAACADRFTDSDSSAVPLSDNRDFDTLPNLQARAQPGIWEQTALGPKTTVSRHQCFRD